MAGKNQQAWKALDDVLEMGRRSGEELRAQILEKGAQVARSVEGLQERALSVLGVAGKAKLEELGFEVEKLAKKINKMAKGGARRGV